MRNKKVEILVIRRGELICRIEMEGPGQPLVITNYTQSIVIVQQRNGVDGTAVVPLQKNSTQSRESCDKITFAILKELLNYIVMVNRPGAQNKIHDLTRRRLVIAYYILFFAKVSTASLLHITLGDLISFIREGIINFSKVIKKQKVTRAFTYNTENKRNLEKFLIDSMIDYILCICIIIKIQIIKFSGIVRKGIKNFCKN